MIDSDKDFENEEEAIAFAKNPFGGIEPRELFFQESDEFNEEIKSVGADASTTFINRLIFWNSEKAGFSDPTLPEKKSAGISGVPEPSIPEDSAARFFVAVSPFEMLFGFGAEQNSAGKNSPENEENEIPGNADETVKNRQKNQNPLEENAGIIDNIASLDNKEEFESKDKVLPCGLRGGYEAECVLEELEKTDDMVTLQEDKCSGGFLFSRFASSYGNSGQVTELPPDAIVQDADGVFSISEEISVSDENQNQKFMDLVQSVLRNRQC